jgi:hypothetical protein
MGWITYGSLVCPNPVVPCCHFSITQDSDVPQVRDDFDRATNQGRVHRVFIRVEIDKGKTSNPHC